MGAESSAGTTAKPGPIQKPMLPSTSGRKIAAFKPTSRPRTDKAGICKWIIQHLRKNESVSNAFPTAEILTSPMPQVLREKLANGFYYNRSGDIQIVLKPGYIDGGATGTTHGLWYPYDAHIPLLWYGYGLQQPHLHCRL
jgi:hypothetical protein